MASKLFELLWYMSWIPLIFSRNAFQWIHTVLLLQLIAELSPPSYIIYTLVSTVNGYEWLQMNGYEMDTYERLENSTKPITNFAGQNLLTDKQCAWSFENLAPGRYVLVLLWRICVVSTASTKSAECRLSNAGEIRECFKN